MKPNPRLKMVLMITLAVLVFAAALLGAWRLILYAQTAPSDAHFPIIVGAIALFGTLWTGAITFAGLLLKDSVDSRSALLQAEAEKRLRADTALKAVELMTKAKPAGQTANEAREAAILVIASLNQPRLALTMGEQFWLADKVSTSTFVLIVNACLASDDKSVKEDAAAALRRNHKKLCLANDAIAFCDAAVLAWDGSLPNIAKYDLLNALLSALLTRERAWWDVELVNWIVYALYKMFTNDRERRFRYLAAMCARELLVTMPLGEDAGIMPPDLHSINYAEMHGEADELMKRYGIAEKNIGVADYKLVDQLRAWCRPKSEAEPKPASRARRKTRPAIRRKPIPTP